MWVDSTHWPRLDHGVLVAQAFIPGGGESVVYFEGNPREARASAKTLWRLLRLTTIAF